MFGSKKYKQQQARRMLRGYRFLQQNNQLGRIRDLNEELAHLPIVYAPKKTDRIIFGAAFSQVDLVVRQYMMRRIAGVNLNRVLLIALGDPARKIVYPLPFKWRELLRKNAFAVAGFRSSVLWNAMVFYIFAGGIVRWFRLFFQNAGSFFSKKQASFATPYAFFSGLQANNLPAPGSDKRSFDIFSWYMQSPGGNKPVKVLAHDIPGATNTEIKGVAITALNKPFLPLPGFSNLLAFAVWFFKAAAISLVHFFTGRWWNALLFSEGVSAALIRLQKKERLAADYLFHNSEWLYRPLWTYEAEAAGARVILYFYSTNIENFKPPHGPVKQTGSWNIINWPVYFVWDEYQADLIKHQVLGEPQINVTGPVWFNTTVKELEGLNQPNIAVFDIAPFRPSRYVMLGQPMEYYVSATAIAFLEDIRNAVTGKEWQLVLKQKRVMGPMIHKEYKSYISKIRGDQNVMVVDADISAFRLIEQTDAVISMPFTSTALIGVQLGKPSVYYDPHGMLQKDDKGAHGVPVISGPDELKKWLENILQSQTKHTIYENN